MFMHILGILVGGVGLVVVILFLFSYLKYGKLGSPPWDIRLPIIRDQLITLVSIATLSNLLFAFGLYFLGKIAAGAASALIIYFAWEDTTSWVDKPWATSLKNQSGLLLWAVIAAEIFWMLL